MILKKQQEELERQAKGSLRLKEQQSRLELEELAEEHRKKLAEIELKGLELEDELSEISENAEESGLTRISPQLTIDEKDRTRHWVEFVDHNQPDAVVVPIKCSTFVQQLLRQVILHQQITWSHQVLQELIVARQLLVIRDCITVTTFTDNNLICRIWSDRRFPLTIQ